MALQDVNCGILVCVDVWGPGEIFVRSFEDGVTACVLSLAGVGERAMAPGDLLRNDRFMASFGDREEDRSAVVLTFSTRQVD